MAVIIRVVAGPHAGTEFRFDARDTFLVGRAPDAHLRLSYDDPYFSRRHFLIESNPPRCVLQDLNSRNGVQVNGVKVERYELKDGDEVTAGTTTFKIAIDDPSADAVTTRVLPTQPAIDSEATAPPARLPGYEFAHLLGVGGMAKVYKSRRLADGRDFAVKVFYPVASSSRKDVDRFLREARILGKLKHPNIVGFEEVVETGANICIVMELVNGPDCGRVLSERGPLAVRMAVRLMAQALTGLWHAHEAGYIHRDIKPSNILVSKPASRPRVAKLADFGLARAYESSHLSGVTMLGEVGGTPAFLPPEQITHYRDVTPAADQYSAAATLYTLLTGHYVFDLPKKMGHRLAHILNNDHVPIRDRRPDVPDGLAKIIHRALSKEPLKRYSTTCSFHKALTRFAG